ncbi:MAG: hypothetical protein NC400_13550 [Clostridium sp.]|nr:hypothetical protein [Clostridium sp.]
MSEFDTNLDAKTVDTLEETDRKCPSCGGVMDYAPKTGGLSCPYCGHTEEITAESGEASSAEELDFESAEKIENCDWGTEKKTVICEACGAESVYDALEISAVCPFCGSNQVMEASDKNTMAPGGVVPFQVTDKQASNLFKAWIKKKWFCPKLAKESAKAKHFKGVYLPYWTFDAQTDSDYQGEFGRDKVKKGPNGDRVVETTWRPVAGHYREAFDDELVCATTNHNQSMLMGIEPYRTAENKAYKPEYVAGFAAERYAVGIKEAWEMGKESIQYKLNGNIEKEIIRKNQADQVRNLRISTRFSHLTYKYLLLPVWISSYKYKDKIYQFMVNGQTGKVSGKTPISVPKVIIASVAAVLLLALIIWLSQQYY